MRRYIGKFLYFLAVSFFSLSVFVNLAEAGIVLKVIAVNPSNEQSQKVQVKA